MLNGLQKSWFQQHLRRFQQHLRKCCEKCHVAQGPLFEPTSSLQAALGVTGVEGAFRKGCESILEVSRQHAADLTRLMRAVLTDPLVQWGGEKKPSSKKVCKPVQNCCKSSSFTYKVTFAVKTVYKEGEG